MSTTTGPPKEPRKLTPEQRARYALRSRLSKFGKRIDELARRLAETHEDRSGMYHYAILPLVSDSQMHGTPTRPGLLRQLERVEADAAAGCETSARFAEEYGPLLRLCDHLRNVRPPPRAADYHPSEILSDYQRQLLASPRRTWADEWEHEEGAD